MSNEELLRHYGILGMKWGVRRTPEQLARARGRATSNQSFEDSHGDYKKAHSKKSVKSMSDAELRSRLNRLQMESQYSKLSQSKINRGKKYVGNMIKTGTTVATLTTTALTIYNNVDKIKSIIEKATSK